MKKSNRSASCALSLCSCLLLAACSDAPVPFAASFDERAATRMVLESREQRQCAVDGMRGVGYARGEEARRVADDLVARLNQVADVSSARSNEVEGLVAEITGIDPEFARSTTLPERFMPWSDIFEVGTQQTLEQFSERSAFSAGPPGLYYERVFQNYTFSILGVCMLNVIEDEIIVRDFLSRGDSAQLAFRRKFRAPRFLTPMIWNNDNAVEQLTREIDQTYTVQFVRYDQGWRLQQY